MFAQAAASLKRDVVVFGVEGYTDRRVETFAKEAHYVKMGELGTFMGILKKTGIRKVVLAGGLPKKEIYNPQTNQDSDLQGFLRPLSNKGDDHFLRAFVLFLKVRCGVSVVDSTFFLKNMLAPKGVLTERRPTEAERRDLNFGYRIAKGIGKLDIGQTVVVKQGVVLAVEALEGTDAAIRRAGGLSREGAVVVKVSKPNQDLRFDLPCVGLETLESLRSVSSKVLGVEAGKTLVLFKEKLIEAADRENIAIVGL